MLAEKAFFSVLRKKNIRFACQNVRIGKETKGCVKKNRCMAGISQRYT
jgi:hypothetical protein